MSGPMTRADQRLDASSLHLAIVAGRFHAAITEKLVEGAVACLKEHGARGFEVDWVPGSFELPLAARALAGRPGVDAVIALGCVVRGETPHFEFVSAEAARGIMTVSLETGVPVSFGVLTTDTLAQAESRAGGAQGNKGWDAALVAIEMALFLRKVQTVADEGP